MLCNAAEHADPPERGKKKKEVLVVPEEAPAPEKLPSASASAYFERLMAKYGTDYQVRACARRFRRR